MKSFHKILTLSLLGGILCVGKESLAMAAEEPVAGINILLEDMSSEQDNVYTKLEEYLVNEDIIMDKSIAFAKVTNYVNIRDTASEDGKIIGKLYDGAIATIMDEKGDWYKIQSGTVEGYVMGDFLVTGQTAIDIAKETGTRIATVSTETLRVRNEKDTTSPVISLVSVGDELSVKNTSGDWVKVKLTGGSTGYVSKDYVQLERVYEEAISIKDEMERLAKEAKAQRIQNQSSNSTFASSQSSTRSQSTHTTSSSTSSSIRNQMVNYALQFEGNPYVWGGTSLLYGADCSGFSQSVYKHFGISIPRTSRSQAASGRSISMNNIKPGDLVFYAKNGTINHVAIYIGNGQVISASSPSTGIRISSVYYRDPVKVVSYFN